MAGTRRRAVIAQEQRGVDYAYACLEQRQSQDAATAAVYHAHNEMPAPGASGGQANARARGGEPLVIMRVSVRGGESFLIGRQPVWNDERDLVVVSSAAQQAIEWRLATKEDPGDLLLRRKLAFQRRKPQTVTDYLDQLVLRQYDVDLDDGAATEEPAQVDVSDVPAEEGPGSAAGAYPEEGAAAPSLEALLLDDLDLPRDGAMRDIVDTVQREQLLLVAHQRPGALVIQGGPGTGKTAVGLYRVMWLLDNQHCSAQDVLVVGPHQGFLAYAGQVLPALGGGDVTTLTLDRLLAGDRPTSATGTDSPEAAFLKGDDRMADVLRRAAEAHCRPHRARVSPLLTAGEDDEAIFRFVCNGRTYEADADALLAIAREALRESGPFNVRQANFRLRLAGKLLLSVPGATPENILSSQEVAAFIQRVWPRLNPTDVYTRLLDSPKTLEAAATLLTADERSALRRSKPGKAVWTAADLVCLDELEWLLNGSHQRRTYAHIVVDEAQDLTPMEARALARRCPSGSMTILGDLAQATGPHEYHSWRELAGLLTGGSAWTVEVLQAGFRLPPEAAEFVEPLARAAAPRVPVARSVRPARGHAVHVQGASSLEHLIEAVAGRVTELTSARDGRSTAVIVPADQTLQDRLRTELGTIHGSTVPILQPHEAKGIEFDHVVVVEPTAIAGETQSGMRGLYVALTRCTQSLSIVHHAALPAPIDGDATSAPPSTSQETLSTVSSASTTASSPAPSPNFEGFLQTAVASDRQQPIHERLRHRLLAQLWETGAPEDGNIADIIQSGESGTLLFEVLHSEEPTYSDLRAAATRTAEIRFALGRPIDRIFLVCAAEPSEPWAVSTIEAVFGVSVIWWENGAWHGADVDTAMPPSSST
ncbi:HelD family protein [Streptomyces sp. NPDC088817]|uniref:HelD family protein n=1 Tax=unclassified Streptomyces TaxID=2593676 RepID=UPI0036F15884